MDMRLQPVRGWWRFGEERVGRAVPRLGLHPLIHLCKARHASGGVGVQRFESRLALGHADPSIERGQCGVDG